MKNKHAAVLSDFLGDMLNISTSKNFPGFFYRSRAHAMIVLIITKSNIKKENMGFGIFVLLFQNMCQAERL